MSTQVLFGEHDAREFRVMNNEHSRDTSSYLNRFLFIFVISAILWWLVLFLMRHDTLPIHHVRIEGKFRHLSPSALKTTISDTVRGGFFSVNVDDIHEALLSKPWVHHVTVKRIWPNSLNITVSEQIAVVRWGNDGLINSDAELFAPEKNTYPEDLPVLTGPKETHQLLFDLYEQTQGKLGLLGLKLTELNLNARRAMTFRLHKGPLILLGREDVESRLERFISYIVDELKDLEGVEVVDLRYTNGFVFSWKDNSSIDNKLRLGNND